MSNNSGEARDERALLRAEAFQTLCAALVDGTAGERLFDAEMCERLRVTPTQVQEVIALLEHIGRLKERAAGLTTASSLDADATTEADAVAAAIDELAADPALADHNAMLVVAAAIPAALAAAGMDATILAAPVEEGLTRIGLTKAEYDVLSTLRAAGAPYRLRPTDVAARLMLTSDGTSDRLRRLAESGQVTREADPADARRSWVQLSEQGIEAAEEAERVLSAAQEAIIRDLPDEDVDALYNAISRVLPALGQPIDADEPDQPSPRTD